MIRRDFQERLFYKEAASFNAIELQKNLFDIGIDLDLLTGHLFYSSHFKPLALNFELIFIRSGETYGSCGQSTETGKIDNELVRLDMKDKEKRVYQGNVDAEINQLTSQGKQQASVASEKLRYYLLENGWEPDFILISPLSRARETALPFLQANKLEEVAVIYDEIKEMSFGDWENRRICDIEPDDPSHFFYKNQHALVKSGGILDEGKEQHSENFCEVLLRAYKVLSDLNNKNAGKRIIMFSHSLFGSACCILLRRGQQYENHEYLAFEGKRSDGTDYAIPHAKPFILNLKFPK